MNERIKAIRKQIEATQQEFANRIGVKRNTVATYEMGRTTPSDSAISLICREFNVNEHWLRTGEGEMFNPDTDNEMDALARRYGLNSRERIMIERFIDLKPSERETIIKYCEDVAIHISEMVASPPAPQPAPEEEPEPESAPELSVIRGNDNKELVFESDKFIDSLSELEFLDDEYKEELREELRMKELRKKATEKSSGSRIS